MALVLCFPNQTVHAKVDLAAALEQIDKGPYLDLFCPAGPFFGRSLDFDDLGVQMKVIHFYLPELLFGTRPGWLTGLGKHLGKL